MLILKLVFVIAGVTIRMCQTTVEMVNSQDTHNVSSHTTQTHVHLCQSRYIYIILHYNILYQTCVLDKTEPEHIFDPPLSPFPPLPLVGGWFLPGNGPICPSSSPPQFSGTPGHSSGSYCERYSSLRSHRAAPYPSHYPHRSTGTSKARLHCIDAPSRQSGNT